MPSSLAAGPASNAEPSPLQPEWLPLPCPGPGSFLSYGLLLETIRPKRMSGIWLRLLFRVTPLSAIAAASCSLSPMPLFPASNCPIPCAGPLGPLLFPVEKNFLMHFPQLLLFVYSSLSSAERATTQSFCFNQLQHYLKFFHLYISWSVFLALTKSAMKSTTHLFGSLLFQCLK